VSHFDVDINDYQYVVQMSMLSDWKINDEIDFDVKLRFFSTDRDVKTS
jgi:hypothetical protein